MGRIKDWIPTTNTGFKEFQDTFCTSANTNQAAWILDTDNVIRLMELQKIYLQCYAVTAVKKGFTGIDTANTKSAKKALKAAVRKMGIDEMKTNANMSNEERDSVGVHNDAGTHTHSPVETTSPVIQSANKGSLGLEMRYSPVGNPKSHELPEGQIGVIVKFGFYKKGDPIPSEKQCTQTVILSKSPAAVTFDSDDFGSLFIGFARYINTRKQLGTVATTFTGGVL